jgi:hypothetical protein
LWIANIAMASGKIDVGENRLHRQPDLLKIAICIPIEF